jgi:hypothetical protein
MLMPKNLPEILEWQSRAALIDWHYFQPYQSVDFQLPRQHAKEMSISLGSISPYRSRAAMAAAPDLRQMGKDLPGATISLDPGEVPTSDFLELGNSWGHTLVFLTISATSTLKSIGSIRGPWRGYHICMDDGTPYGAIWLDDAWVHPAQAKFEFIVVSMGKMTSISSIDLPEAEPCLDEFSDLDAFHVLMLHYPKHPSLAERFALGVVLRAKFLVAGAAWKRIWLA